MNTNNSRENFLSPHPGEILKGEIEEHGLSQRELASAIGKSAPMVNGILSGNKDITVEIAILLEAALPGGLRAKDWLRLQNEHTNLNALRRRLEFGNDFVGNISMIMDTLGISTLAELRNKLETSKCCFTMVR